MNQEMGYEKRYGKGAHLLVKKVLVLVLVGFGVSIYLLEFLLISRSSYVSSLRS
jgi:hypothetical protein